MVHAIIFITPFAITPAAAVPPPLLAAIAASANPAGAASTPFAPSAAANPATEGAATFFANSPRNFAIPRSTRFRAASSLTPHALPNLSE